MPAEFLRLFPSLSAIPINLLGEQILRQLEPLWQIFPLLHNLRNLMSYRMGISRI